MSYNWSSILKKGKSADRGGLNGTELVSKSLVLKTKERVNYIEAAEGADRCAGCRFFVPPYVDLYETVSQEGKKRGYCSLVEGSIHPDAVCDLFESTASVV